MANKGINKVILIGHLGQSPELRQLNNGNPVVNLSLATSEQWKDKQTGEQREKTEWHRIVLFSHLADIANKYLTKGSKVYISGKLQTRKWQDNGGNDRYTTEIQANELQMLDIKRTQAVDTSIKSAPQANNNQVSSAVQNVVPYARQYSPEKYVAKPTYNPNLNDTHSPLPTFDDLDDIPF